MRKKILLITIMIVIATFFVTCNFSEAINVGNIKNDQSKVSSTLKKAIENIGKDTYSVLLTIGIISSVVVLTIIGIKYMMGSVEEKAEYKKSLMPYVIGCVLVFAASTLANILYTLLTK